MFDSKARMFGLWLAVEEGENRKGHDKCKEKYRG